MSYRIHPTACIDRRAQIADDCEVHAGAILGAHVSLACGCIIEAQAQIQGDDTSGATLAEGCRIGTGAIIGPRVRMGPANSVMARAIVVGRTTLGPGNTLHPYAVVGGPPQDLGFAGDDTRLEIGAHNIFREHVTVNVATHKESGVTVIGSHNFLMAASHVGHDGVLGDHITLTNGVLLAGHVHIEDHVTIGGMSCVAQYRTVGRHAFVGGFSSVASDAPPYMITGGGYDAKIRGVNVVGLRRAGFSAEAIEALKRAWSALYKDPRDAAGNPCNFATALAALEARGDLTSEVAELLAFERRTANSIGRNRQRGFQARPQDKPNPSPSVKPAS